MRDTHLSPLRVAFREGMRKAHIGRAAAALVLLSAVSSMAYVCYTYAPKLCQAATAAPGLPLPCNFYMSTACWTRGDCSGFASSGSLYADGSTTETSCQYVATLRVLCIYIYSGSIFTYTSVDGNCAPASCPPGGSGS